MTGLLITLLLGVGISFAESGLGLGMVFPGETAVVVLAATMLSGPEIVLLGIFVALGASAGDHVGFAIGRRYGDALRGTGVVRRLGVDHYDHATTKLRRHGGLAVFLTRLVPVVRTLTPAAAGASGLSYRRFAPASLAGSAMWAGIYVGGGSMAAAVAAMTSSALGGVAWLVPALAVLAVMPLVLRRWGSAIPSARAVSENEALLELTFPARHRLDAQATLVADVQV